MNPDAYFPFYGNDFLSACEGYPESLVSAYIRLLWHYWHVNHCDGLRNDDAFLQRVTRLNDEDWQTLQPILLGEFFKLDDDGLWKQKRAREEWENAVKTYRARVLGGKRRWQR